jgi:predicted RNase H-like nuclease (RuvC/YqgF family)
MCAHSKKLERELAAKTAEFDRLNESLAKNKRLFSNPLADGIIESQLKRIKQLEDHLSLALQAMDNLRQSMRGGAP